MHYSVMRQLINGDFQYEDTGLLDSTHIHFFTFNEIVRMFGNAGYVVEYISNLDTQAVASSEEQKFVANLMSISENASEFMFYAFQYLVSAKVVK